MDYNLPPRMSDADIDYLVEQSLKYPSLGDVYIRPMAEVIDDDNEEAVWEHHAPTWPDPKFIYDLDVLDRLEENDEVYELDLSMV